MIIGLSVVIALLAIGGAILWRLKSSGATLYWFHSNGFRAIHLGSAGEKYYPVDSEQLRTAAEAVFEGTRLDHLFLGCNEVDLYITLSKEEGSMILSVQFLTQRDTELIRRTKEALSAFGLPLIDEMTWNEGMGPDLESTTLRFQAPDDLARACEALELAFQLRYENPRERWIGGMRSADFHTKDWGPSIQLPQDRLGPILGIDNKG